MAFNCALKHVANSRMGMLIRSIRMFRLTVIQSCHIELFETDDKNTMSRRTEYYKFLLDGSVSLLRK